MAVPSAVNRVVVGSTPTPRALGKYLSGQKGQTVNLLLRLRRFKSCLPL